MRPILNQSVVTHILENKLYDNSYYGERLLDQGMP